MLNRAKVPWGNELKKSVAYFCTSIISTIVKPYRKVENKDMCFP